MSSTTDDPWSWEREDNVLICDQRGWNEGTEAEIKELMDQFASRAERPSVTASLTLLDPDINLGPERQAVIEQNAPVYDDLGIEKQALVSDGIAGLALQSLVELPPGMEIETFDDRESALAWCRD